MWRTTATSGLLTEPERIAVVVTEMLRLSADADDATRRAATQILSGLLNEPDLTADDRRIIQATLNVSGAR